MKQIKTSLSLFLVLILIFSAFFSVPISAETVRKGYINASGVGLRAQPTTSSTRYTSLNAGYIDVLGEVNGQEAEKGYGTIWYKVSYNGQEGYVYGRYVIFPNEGGISAGFQAQLNTFPESYHSYLIEINKLYPNWSFIADRVPITFDTAVDKEYETHTRKLVSISAAGQNTAWFDPRCYVNGAYESHDATNTWTGASKSAIAYFMDPRNFLKTDSIFMFATLGYNRDIENEAGLRTVISGSFLENGYDGDKDAYIKDIMYAADQTNSSPYYIAAKIIAEQGRKGESALISGTYTGFEGYYNFFNIGASGEGTTTIIVNGLTYARDKGWDSRRKAILEGSRSVDESYFKRGQDTYYYMNYNVKNEVWWQQYAQNIQDAYNKGCILSDGYIDDRESRVVFKIPVYYSMSDTPAKIPGSEPEPKPEPEPEPKPEPPAPPQIMVGDINGDKAINALDLAAVKLHMLGKRTVDISVGDINGDKTINALDLAAIKLHILGVRLIA